MCTPLNTTWNVPVSISFLAMHTCLSTTWKTPVIALATFAWSNVLRTCFYAASGLHTPLNSTWHAQWVLVLHLRVPTCCAHVSMLLLDMHISLSTTWTSTTWTLWVTDATWNSTTWTTWISPTWITWVADVFVWFNIVTWFILSLASSKRVYWWGFARESLKDLRVSCAFRQEGFGSWKNYVAK